MVHGGTQLLHCGLAWTCCRRCVELWAPIYRPHSDADGCGRICASAASHHQRAQEVGLIPSTVRPTILVLLISWKIASTHGVDAYESALAPPVRFVDAPQSAQGAAGYFFEMDPRRREAFVRSVRSLDLGTPRENVVDALGPPDSEHYTGPKSDPRPAAITGRALIYYVTRWRQGLVNTKRDQVLRLWFDRETDRLRSIVSSVPEIQGRGAGRDLSPSK